jgi:hypothetical protein
MASFVLGLSEGSRTIPTITKLGFVLLFVALICIITRVRTGIQNKRQSASRTEPKEIAVLPYWLPWLGHAIQFGARFQNFLADARSLHPDDYLLTSSHADARAASIPKMESSMSFSPAQSTTLSSNPVSRSRFSCRDPRSHQTSSRTGSWRSSSATKVVSEAWILPLSSARYTKPCTN